METNISPKRKRQTRALFQVYNALNSFSFLFLSGAIITLYSLSLGATSSFIGLLGAFNFLAFFFMPIGKRLTKHFPLIPVFGWSWLIRYASMIPVLFTPLLFFAGKGEVALGVILLSSASFNIFRGIGLIGNNPLIASLTSGRERGRFIVSIQIVGSIVNILGSLLIAFALGAKSSPVMYIIFMTLGIVTGIIGSIIIFKFPEPKSGSDDGKSNLIETSIEALKDSRFRNYLYVFTIVSFTAGVARTFITVYAKTVYAQSDAIVIVYTVVGFIGAVFMGLLTKILVDRIGAKPLYVFYTAVSALSLLPAIISPIFSNPLLVMVYLALVHFFLNFGFAGEENAAQTYFFALVKPEKMLDLAIVYYLVFGLAGAAGSVLGGFSLDVLEAVGLSLINVYRVSFSMLFVFLIIAMFLQRRLAHLGSASFKETLGIIFSLRDLRAISMLDRLDHAQTQSDERRLIAEISQSSSSAIVKEMIERLSSPRLEVRVEALHALENRGTLDDLSKRLKNELLMVLQEEVKTHAFTTAYIAARILGKYQFSEAISLLHETMYADDYMLVGESMLALARLQDASAVQEIEKILANSENPRLLIFGASALETLKSRKSIPALLDLLKRENPPEFLRDEIILSLSGILGFEQRFYASYIAFLADSAQGLSILRDNAEALARTKSEAGGAAKTALNSLFLDESDGAPLGRILLQIPEEYSYDEDIILAEAALDPQLLRFKRLKFLLAAYGIERAKYLEDSERSFAKEIEHTSYQDLENSE